MARRTGSAKKVALGGMMSALSITIMFMGSVIPSSEFITVVFAGLVMIAVSAELGVRYASTVYASVGILSFILLPSKEIALMFCAIFGYYPIIKFKMDRLNPKIRFIAKFLLFNITFFVAQALMLYILTTEEVRKQILSNHPMYTLAFIVLSNVFFALYDRFVMLMWFKYYKVISPIIKRIF